MEKLKCCREQAVYRLLQQQQQQLKKKLCLDLENLHYNCRKLAGFCFKIASQAEHYKEVVGTLVQETVISIASKIRFSILPL